MPHSRPLRRTTRGRPHRRRRSGPNGTDTSFPKDMLLPPGARLKIHTKQGSNSQTDFYIGQDAATAPRFYSHGKQPDLMLHRNGTGQEVRYPVPAVTPVP